MTHDRIEQPNIVRYVQHQRDGVSSHNIARHAVGYIAKGTKYVYYGDVRHRISHGDLFYFAPGSHYVENEPENARPYEEFVVYYTARELGRILSDLSGQCCLDEVGRPAVCGNLEVVGAWGMARNFFSALGLNLRSQSPATDSVTARLKMIELLYILLSNRECPIGARLVAGADTMREDFEQTMRSHIFTDVSIEELAGKCNRSATSFKQEFRRHFEQPPHRWFTAQRLMHSRLLLLSTTKTISEIGSECRFSNTSHFIKMFKREYGSTPARFRQQGAAS